MKYFNVSNNGLVHIEDGEPINIWDYTPGKLNVHIEFLSERSIPDELENETSENLWIVIISYLCMFVYIGVAIG
jgi:hypothetical protein